MTPGDWINSILTLATVAMAAGTFYLAIVTQKLTDGAVQEIKQTDRHHQENLRPFCVIDFSDASEQHPFGIEFDPDSRRRRALMAGEEQITQPPELRLHGNLRNKGNGPATDVVV